MMRKLIRDKRIIYFIFVLYIVILLAVLVFKFPTGMVSGILKRKAAGETIQRFPMQLVPFKTIIDYARQVHSLSDWFFKNLACNIVMFVPFGVLFPIILKKTILNKNGVKSTTIAVTTIIGGMLLSIGIELTQYITCLGQCDIDDVILNTLGVIIGVIFIFKVVSSKDK